MLVSRDDLFEWRKVAVSLTSLCNLRCKMCPLLRTERASLSREQAFHVADFAQRRGFSQMIITGGEPTIMPYFCELMEQVGQTDMEVQLLTNACRMPDEHIQCLTRCRKLIVNVSIDGLGEVHDAIRGEGTFAATIKSVDRLLSAAIQVAVNTTVQRSNFRTVVETYEFLAKYPLAWHGFSFAEPFHGLELVPLENVDEALSNLQEVCRRNEARKGHAGLPREMITCFRLWLRYPGFNTHPGRNCPIPRRQLGVEHTGLVVPCFHYVDWNRGPERNINHHSLDEIVDSSGYREMVCRAIGINGCPGCSTLCYFLDDDYRQKTLHPRGRLRFQRAALLGKEYIRRHHPELASTIHRVRQRTGL
jgi:MoaA/NifB/PqqE/SkfB family radical SAM enzyme